MDGWMDGWMERWMGGWIDGSHSLSQLPCTPQGEHVNCPVVLLTCTVSVFPRGDCLLQNGQENLYDTYPSPYLMLLLSKLVLMLAGLVSLVELDMVVIPLNAKTGIFWGNFRKFIISIQVTVTNIMFLLKLLQLDFNLLYCSMIRILRNIDAVSKMAVLTSLYSMTLIVLAGVGSAQGEV